jgi:hypothetical protein
MVIGDGIRRDISKVTTEERNRFITAIVKLDKNKFFPDGISYWDKQEEIHKNAHFSGVDVHAGPAFISWHRVIVNRLEQLLREVDPALSLHYWDWTTDPRSTAGGRAALFTPEFMGNSSGNAGHLLDDFESSEAAEIPGSTHDKIWREVGLVGAKPDGTPNIVPDSTILSRGNFKTFGDSLKGAHDSVAHSYIGGSISNPHYSFHDPFVFLLHSNVDRLWARWQTEPGHPERMNPSTAYSGLNPAEIFQLSSELVEPWAGGSGLEPWASDPTKRALVTYRDLSVVTPPCYDTNQSNFQVLEAENPFNADTSRYQIIFNDVPEEETTWRAAVIRVHTCGDFTIRVKPGTEPTAPYSTVTPYVSKHHGPDPFVDVRIWFQFTAGAVPTAPEILPVANTTLKCDENGQEFQFELRANTIHRPTVAVMLALDQSGSMGWQAGTSGATRLQVLQDAAELFANLIQKNNGIGIIRFDQDAYPPNDPTYGGMPITKILADGFGDSTRSQALGVIASHGIHGATSVGDGLEMARNQLNALPAGSYDRKTIILFTDGLENRPKSIDEVSGMINNTTFAVGLGREMEINTRALATLAGSTGGYLRLSGLLSSSIDDQFMVRKFFLQILAGVTNTSIVKDPIGYVNVGTQVRIPFRLSEADINCRVILVTDFPVVKLFVETPDGKIIDEANASSFGVTFDTTNSIKTSSFSLPVAFLKHKIHAGTWFAILEIDKEQYKKILSGQWEDANRVGREALADLRSKGAKYCLSAHSFSNLRMNATLNQNGFVPGSVFYLRAVLTEYNLPVEKRAFVKAEIEYPDKTNAVISLTEEGPGIFIASLVAPIAGVYRSKITAEGGTYMGVPFTREQILDGAVFNTGDQPPPGTTSDFDICLFLKCLVEDKGIQRYLKEKNIDQKIITNCIEEYCRRGGT